MLFFRPNFREYSNWCSIAIVLGLAIFSTSAIATTKNTANQPQTIPSDVIIDKVFVDKSARTLQLLSDDKVIKSYHIALGGNPIGHKQQQGDQRTPVGSYTLD